MSRRTAEAKLWRIKDEVRFLVVVKCALVLSLLFPTLKK